MSEPDVQTLAVNGIRLHERLRRHPCPPCRKLRAPGHGADAVERAVRLFHDRILFQRRIEEGRLSSYIDRAIRVDNPQMLTSVGTIQAQWMPDKGDLIQVALEPIVGRGSSEIVTGPLNPFVR